jgi:hypothetical protein
MRAKFAIRALHPSSLHPSSFILYHPLMPLFQRKRFVWYEPWFFQQRIRTAKSWVLFALLLLAVAVAVGAALYFSAPQGKPFPLLEAAGLGIGIAAAVWWVLDGANTRRQAVLFENSIVVGGDMGKYSHPQTYNLSEIAAAAIVMPEESNWHAPALFFLYRGQEEGIGIESKAGLKRLAQALHEAGVPVRLATWQPNEEREFEKAFSWRAGPGQAMEQAKLEILPEGTPSMMSPGGILLAIVRQCWPVAVWLLVTAGAIYYGYVNWRNLGLVEVGLLIIVPIGVMYLAGEFIERFATAQSTRGLIRMTRRQFRKRAGIELDPSAEDLLPVEVFTRDQFANVVQKIPEMGFLQADASGRRMLFEGKQQRWTIPAGSIQSLAIEEVQSGNPGQSAIGSLNYYVVVRFAVAYGTSLSVWESALVRPDSATPSATSASDLLEIGFRHSGRDYGKFDDIKRAQGAIRVFEAFEAILSSK